MDDEIVKFELWDSETSRPLYRLYYRDADAAVVVYDITTNKFDNAKSWVKELWEKASPNIVIALVGCKADLSSRRNVKYEVRCGCSVKSNPL